MRPVSYWYIYIYHGIQCRTHDTPPPPTHTHIGGSSPTDRRLVRYLHARARPRTPTHTHTQTQTQSHTRARAFHVCGRTHARTHARTHVSRLPNFESLRARNAPAGLCYCALLPLIRLRLASRLLRLIAPDCAILRLAGEECIGGLCSVCCTQGMRGLKILRLIAPYRVYLHTRAQARTAQLQHRRARAHSTRTCACFGALRSFMYLYRYIRASISAYADARG